MWPGQDLTIPCQINVELSSNLDLKKIKNLWLLPNFARLCNQMFWHIFNIWVRKPYNLTNYGPINYYHQLDL